MSRATRDRVLAVAKELGYEKQGRFIAGAGVIGFVINERTTAPELSSSLEDISGGEVDIDGRVVPGLPSYIFRLYN